LNKGATGGQSCLNRGMATRTVTIPNISCQHCANTIKRELADVDGVIRVDVDIATKKVTVEWQDPQTRWQDIQKKLEEINYPPHGNH